MSGMFPVASFPCICYRTEDYHCVSVSVSRLFGSPLSRSIFVYEWPRLSVALTQPVVAPGDAWVAGEKVWVGYRTRGSRRWLAGCMVNRWGGNGQRMYVLMLRPPLPVLTIPPHLSRRERGWESGRGCGRQRPRRLSSNMALNLCKIIANQRTDKTAPKNAHNPQRLLRVGRLFQPTTARKSAHNPPKPLTI